MNRINEAVQDLLMVIERSDSGATDPIDRAKWEPVRNAAERLRHVLDADRYAAPVSLHTQLPGHRAFDEIIEKKIFLWVEQAISREALLDYLLEQLAPTSQADAMFYIEAISTSQGWLEYQGGKCVGIHPARWDTYTKQVLPQFADSPLFASIVRGGQSIDLQYSAYLGDTYRGEFEALLREPTKSKGHGFWFTAIPLKSGARVGQVSRALFALYPNRGDEIQPKYPGGVLQEIRAVRFAAVAYQFLEHRLRHLSRRILENRKSLINELGPGILHHELGMGLSIVRNGMITVLDKVHKLAEEYDHPKIATLERDVSKVADIMLTVYALTDAFNNLERRHPTEDFSLAKPIEEAIRLCHFRMVNVGLRPGWPQFSSRTSSGSRLIPRLHSDAGLLLHVLVNLISNACDACVGWSTPDGKPKALKWVVETFNQIGRQGRTEPWVRLLVCNNGPVVNPEKRDHIFGEGVTTKAGGHGQGLYLSSQIAQYLGGHIALVDPKALQDGMRVGFEICIPRTIPTHEEFGL